MNLRTAAKYLRLTPFDAGTEQGRADERQRRIVLSGAASALNKLVTISTGLISVPLTLHYLGAERFGLWMAISSIITMMAFADLGIGNGLLNAVSHANGKDDFKLIQKYISSAVIILGGIAVFILLLFNAISPLIDWAKVFNVKTPLAIAESGLAIHVFVICLSANILAGIIQRVQMGLQLSYVTNIWQAAGSVLALTLVILSIQLELGLPWLVAAMAGAPVLSAAINSYHFFYHTHPALKPKLSLASISASRQIAKTGFLFLILQLTSSIAFYSDNIIISNMIGAEAVTQYAIPEKMFSMITMVIGMLLMPLWPAYTEAISRGDAVWLKTVFKRSLLLAVGASASLSVLMVLLAQQILSLWLGHAVSPPMLLLAGLGVWKVLENCGTALAMLLNGANIIKAQFFMASLLAVFSIGLKIFLIHRYGFAASVWATIIAYCLCTLLPLYFMVPKILLKITNSPKDKSTCAV